MKITRLRWTAYAMPFRAPYVTALGASSMREGLVLQLETDTGVTGLGEAALTPEVPDAAALLLEAMQSLAPTLLGRDLEAPLDAADCLDEVSSAVRAAIDIAALDALATSRGVSIASLLTPTPSAAVELNALVTAGPREAAVQAALRARDTGYRTLKLKVGVAPNLAAERDRIAAVRAAIGPGIALRIDPNGAWTLNQAIESITALAEYAIEYVEQPVAPFQLEALKAVQDAVAVPIAADEDVTDLPAALRIIETAAARVLILKPQRLGGLRASRAIIEAATRASLRVVVTTSIETGIGTAACLQLAASLPAGSPACGLATASLLTATLSTPDLPILEGSMRLPTTPGLGVHLDASAAAYLGEWRELPA